MKNTITRVDALNNAITVLNTLDASTIDREATAEILTKIRDQIAKPRKTSDETKAKRKEKNAVARASLMEQVMPIIRDGIGDGGTAKEIFERCKESLPDDFSDKKVQYILLHEMAKEVEKIETKGKPNVYKRKA